MLKFVKISKKKFKTILLLTFYSGTDAHNFESAQQYCKQHLLLNELKFKLKLMLWAWPAALFPLVDC